MKGTRKPGKLLGTPVASKSVVTRIIDRISGAIITGELKPGSKIPTESELCDSFQVSRNSIREAIKILESYGVLYIKNRSEGTFVTSGFTQKMLDPMLYGLILQKDSATDILELRQVFDIGILHVVAEKAENKRIAAIRKACEELSAEVIAADVIPEKLLEADVAFHKAVVDASDNPLIASVAAYIDRITIPSRIRTMHSIMEQGMLSRFLELHERIVRVVEQRDFQGIADTVRDHYQFWERETIGMPPPAVSG